MAEKNFFKDSRPPPTPQEVKKMAIFYYFKGCQTVSAITPDWKMLAYQN